MKTPSDFHETRDRDFQDMERRPGGGGAGSVVWAIGLALLCVGTFALIYILS
jgi:hypothetical protein